MQYELILSNGENIIFELKKEALSQICQLLVANPKELFIELNCPDHRNVIVNKSLISTIRQAKV
jgi:hypothetical protein